MMSRLDFEPQELDTGRRTVSRQLVRWIERAKSIDGLVNTITYEDNRVC
jgi:hypothetical protein